MKRKYKNRIRRQTADALVSRRKISGLFVCAGPYMEIGCWYNMQAVRRAEEKLPPARSTGNFDGLSALFLIWT